MEIKYEKLSNVFLLHTTLRMGVSFVEVRIQLLLACYYLLNLLNYNFWQYFIIFLHADILCTKVSHLRVSVLLFQSLILCSNYAICGERTVS